MIRKRQARRELAAAAVCIALLTGACAGSSGGDTTTTVAGTTSVAEATTTMAETTTTAGEFDLTDVTLCNVDGAKITFVVPLRGIPIVDQLLVAANHAAEDCGASLTDVGPQAFDPPAAVQALQDSVAAGAEAVVFDALPPDIYETAVRDISIPMAQYIAAVTFEGAPIFAGANQFDLGAAIAGLIISELAPDATGTVVVGNCAPGLEDLDRRVEAIKSTFADSMPSVTVTGALETSTDPSQNFTVWQGIIQANPDALAFLGVCDQDLPSLTRIKQQDPSSTYLLAGADIQIAALEGIQEGIVVGSVGQHPYLEGYIPVRLVSLMLAGLEIPASGWLNTGLDIVDASNVDEVLARELDPDVAREYYRPLVDEILADLESRIRPFEAINAPTE